MDGDSMCLSPYILIWNFPIFRCLMVQNPYMGFLRSSFDGNYELCGACVVTFHILHNDRIYLYIITWRFFTTTMNRGKKAKFVVTCIYVVRIHTDPYTFSSVFSYLFFFGLCSCRSVFFSNSEDNVLIKNLQTRQVVNTNLSKR